MTFRELAERMRETAYAAYDHERAPFEKVVEAAGVTRSLDRQPLMSVMFVLQNVPGRPLSLRGLRATVLTMPEPAKTDLALTVGEEDGRLVGVWEYNAALFDAAAVSGFQENMVTLLGAALSDPDTELRSLPC